MCSENKGANQMYCVTTQLICGFVFSFAKILFFFFFFHGVTQIVNVTGNDIHFKRINSTHPYMCCVYCIVCTCDSVPDI